MRVPSRYNQAHERRLKIRIFNKIRRHVALNVMNPYQRFSGCISDCLCLRHTNQKSAYQAGTVGDCDSRYLFQTGSCLSQCALDHIIDSLYMFAGRNFRHNAPINRVGLNLGCDHIRAYGSSIFHHSRRRLIAGALYGKY